MAELERALVLLGEELDVPATPPLADAVRERIRRRRYARRLVVVAIPLFALAIAFAVPQARSAILDFFHLGAEKVQRVETLPPARQRSLTAGLGQVLVREDAEQAAGLHAQLGRIVPSNRWWSRDDLLATLLPRTPPVLLIEISGDQLAISKKYTTGDVQPTNVGGSFALWIAGPHVLTYVGRNPRPQTVARYAGNALVWARNGITFRLEGEPTLRAALRDATQITP